MPTTDFQVTLAGQTTLRFVQVAKAPACEELTASLGATVVGVHLDNSGKVYQRRAGRFHEHTFHPGLLER